MMYMFGGVFAMTALAIFVGASFSDASHKEERAGGI